MFTSETEVERKEEVGKQQEKGSSKHARTIWFVLIAFSKE